MLEIKKFGLSSIDDGRIYNSFILNSVDSEHFITYAFHTRYVKEKRILMRKFQLGCVVNLTNFEPQLRAEYFVIYTYILEFLDDFLTEDAMNPEKISDDRMLDFFAYAYNQIAYWWKKPFDSIAPIVRSLEEYDSEIFNAKKHPQYELDIVKLITHLREKGLDISSEIYRNYYSANFGFVKNYTTGTKEKGQLEESKDEAVGTFGRDVDDPIAKK